MTECAEPGRSFVTGEQNSAGGSDPGGNIRRACQRQSGWQLTGGDYGIAGAGISYYVKRCGGLPDGKKNCESDTLPPADGGAGSAEMRESGSSLSCLQRFLLQPAMVRKVMELTEQAGITYEALVEGNAYADPAYISDPTGFGAVREAIPYIRRTRIPVEDIRGFLRSHENQLDSLDIIVGDPEKKKRLMALLNKECADIYVTSSVEQLIEISDRRAGKHSAVKFLRNGWKLRRRRLPPSATGIMMRKCFAKPESELQLRMRRRPAWRRQMQ